MTVSLSTAGENVDAQIASAVGGKAAAIAEPTNTVEKEAILELFNPIADADEIIYDSSKEYAGDDVDLGTAPEHSGVVRDTTNDTGTGEAILGSGTASTERHTSPSPAASPTTNNSFLFLVLRAMGGCLLRPRRRDNDSVTSPAPRKGLHVCLFPKRKGIRGRLQLIKSRSSSSDNSDPVTATTSVGERDLSSGGSGDSADKSSVGRSFKLFHNLPANSDPHIADEFCDSSASEACNVPYHDSDDDTLDDASYAFSQAAGICEETIKVYVDIDIDIGGIASIGDDIGNEVLLTSSNVGADGGDGDAISILFDDEGEDDEADDDVFATSLGDANEMKEDEIRSSCENDEYGSSESPSMLENNPDELDYVHPRFTHKSLRQASEKQTCYNFVNDEEESGDETCLAD